MLGVKIGIRFVEKDIRRWLRAILSTERVVKIMSRDVPRLASVDYKQLLIGNIMTQKGMAGYAPYNPRYELWKAQYGRAGGGFWKLFGDLVTSITSMKVTDRYGRQAYFTGVPKGVMDRGGKSWLGMGNVGPPKEIAWYGTIMEEGGTYYTKAGTQHHPARPIFEPTMEEYAQSGWLKRGDEALQAIGRRWK